MEWLLLGMLDSKIFLGGKHYQDIDQFIVHLCLVIIMVSVEDMERIEIEYKNLKLIFIEYMCMPNILNKNLKLIFIEYMCMPNILNKNLKLIFIGYMRMPNI